MRCVGLRFANPDRSNHNRIIFYATAGVGCCDPLTSRTEHRGNVLVRERPLVGLIKSWRLGVRLFVGFPSNRFGSLEPALGRRAELSGETAKQTSLFMHEENHKDTAETRG